MTMMTIKSVDRDDRNLILVTDYDYERKAMKRTEEENAVHDFLCGLFKPLLGLGADYNNDMGASTQKN